MGFYQDQIVPLLINLAMRNKDLETYRRRIVPQAEGRVLEIGIGSGPNLPFYSSSMRQVIGLEPSSKLVGMTRRMARSISRPVELIEGTAEDIPVETAAIDTVITTWTLCSIPDATRALGEMRRVLKPGGRLLFVEHGRAPDRNVEWWQDRLTPAWRRIAGGCHLNRAITGLIEAAGFHLERCDTGYMRGPRPMTFMYEGSARPR